ncbi:MAG: nucleotidyl transferase AbiEii/AbiGii toxin family protein [Bacteroidota bacterium]
MIPRSDITAWRSESPWVSDAQVEQDLIISRALVELFSNNRLTDGLAFRGGTALHKLFLQPAARYSEDIDLVQISGGPIGTILDNIHMALDPWLGTSTNKRSESGVTLAYKVDSEIPPIIPLRLKIEINTREHFMVFGLMKKDFKVAARWFKGSCKVTTYELSELLGTKLRALYQRRKGRDLFDLWLGITFGHADPKKIADSFEKYMLNDEIRVSAKEFQKNLDLKMVHKGFLSDIMPLIRPEIEYDAKAAYTLVSEQLIPLIAG